MSLSHKIGELQDHFDERPASEKILIALAVIAALIWLGFSLILSPVNAERARLDTQLTQAGTQLAMLQQREQQALASGAQDPNSSVRARIARAAQQQAELDGDIQALAGNLVTPNSMTRVLTSILARQSGLSLIRVENSAPQLVQNSASDTSANSTTDAQRIYRHSMVLELEGDYLSLITYLLRIEGLPERFFWDSLSFSQLSWPQGRIVLQLHTLSTEEGFVGV